MFTIGMNFIHVDHLARAARIFQQERHDELPYAECYPSFVVLALTTIVQILEGHTEKDYSTVQMLRDTWDILEKMPDKNRVEVYTTEMEESAGLELDRRYIEYLFETHTCTKKRKLFTVLDGI